MPTVSGAKRGQPLFELLRDQPGQPRGSGSADGAPRGPSEIRIPMSTAYIGIALVIGLVLLAWVGGHAVGFRAGKAEVTREFGGQDLDGLTISDPVRETRAQPPSQGGAQAPAARPSTTPRVSEPDRPVSLPDPVVHAGGEAVIISPRGLLRADPRTPETNYLVLATLDEAAASDAVQFLAANGLEAVAVPTSAGSDRYRVVSLGLAVPSGQFREMGDQRRAHERLVADLGAKWLREQRGASDFSRPQWALYRP